jgi:hypothetical protein
MITPSNEILGNLLPVPPLDSSVDEKDEEQDEDDGDGEEGQSFISRAALWS